MTKWDICALVELKKQDGDYANTWAVSVVGNGPEQRSRGGGGRFRGICGIWLEDK